MVNNGNNSPRSGNHNWCFTSAAAAGRPLAPCPLSHSASKSRACMQNQTWDPARRHQCMSLRRGREQVPGGWRYHFPSSDTCMTDRLGIRWRSISKAEYLSWVWPQLQAPGQEGPLQNLMCPSRMQVLKSIPTNKLWPHTVRHPGHSPWQILWL